MIIETIRHFDYSSFFYLYHFAEKNNYILPIAIFVARYGILIFFFSFIYLVINRKIPAFLCALFSMGLAGIIDFIVFIFWQRPSPFVTYSDLVSTSLSGVSNFGSFPSSHTYVAFGIATSLLFFGHRKLGFFLFVAAIVLALSRVMAGYHYPSDVVGGIILGILSGIIVRLFFKKWENFSYEKNGRPLGA